MPEIWPTDLPTSFLTDSFSEDQRDPRIRSNMDGGPAKVRRRFTSVPGKMRGSLILTTQQIASLRTFVETTTIGGTLTFWFPDPVFGALRVVRFGESLPRWTFFSLGQWLVELDLETL